MNLSPEHLKLIQSLAEHAAREDYLAAQANTDAGAKDEHTKPVPLPATSRAA